MTDFIKRTWAQVDLDAIAQNYRQISSTLSDGCRVMAVVKADAYGHGAGYVARTLRDCGVTWFGVSNLDEAIQIRDEGIKAPILIFGYTPPNQVHRLAEYDITQTVFNREYAIRMSEEAVSASVSVRVHIKIDTGMSRLGFFCHDSFDCVIDDIEEVCSLPKLVAEGIYTHFASADDKDQSFTYLQFERFKKALSLLENRGISFSLRHCCNSAATIRFPEMHMEIVRPGIILYGLYPAPWLADLMSLKPSMELKTVISMVKTVPTGTLVSYGHAFTTDKETTLATIPIGYADGFTRCLSNCANMLIKGMRAPVVGRVCMDQCLLDVTAIDGVTADDTVTVFGKDGDAVLTVDEFASLCGTINYETVCLIGKRVPRVYQSGGKTIGHHNYIAP